MHDHNHCQHTNLKFCSVCNVVYCVDCKKEWKENYSNWTWSQPLMSTYTGGAVSYYCSSSCSHESEVNNNEPKFD